MHQASYVPKVHYTEHATTKTERAETIPPGFHSAQNMLATTYIYTKMLIANNSENQRTDSWLPCSDLLTGFHFP